MVSEEINRWCVRRDAFESGQVSGLAEVLPMLVKRASRNQAHDERLSGGKVAPQSLSCPLLAQRLEGWKSDEKPVSCKPLLRAS